MSLIVCKGLCDYLVQIAFEREKTAMSGTEEASGMSAAELRRIERKKKLLARSEKSDELLNSTLASGNVGQLEAKEPTLSESLDGAGRSDPNQASIDGLTREVQNSVNQEQDEHSNLTGQEHPGLHRDLFEEFKQDLKNQKEYERYVNMKTIVCLIAGFLSAILVHFENIPGNIFITLLFADIMLILYFSRSIKKRPTPNLAGGPPSQQDKLIQQLGQWQARLTLFFELFDDLGCFVIPFLMTMCFLMIISPKGPAIPSDD